MGNKIFRTRAASMVGLVLGAAATATLSVSRLLPSPPLDVVLMLAAWAIGALVGACGDKAVLKKAFPKGFAVPFAAAALWVALSRISSQSGTVIIFGGAAAAGIGAFAVSRRE